jgi:trans-aconitate methyltransferase
MNLIERATVIHYHRWRIENFGEQTTEALGWMGPDSQTKRFEAIVKVGNFGNSTVLDVGCGYGDLKSFLDKRYQGVTFIGIDQVPEFIAAAQTTYRNRTDANFYQCDFATADFPEVDFVVASGALSYRCSDPEFYTGMVRKLFEAATRGTAFNMLDAARFPEHPLLVGHDREKILTFCRTLTPRVELVEGYLDEDFTVLLYPR